VSKCSHTARVPRQLRNPVAVAILAAAVSKLFVVISLTTDHWEHIEYSSESLWRIPAVRASESFFDDVNGFYVVTFINAPAAYNTSRPTTDDCVYDVSNKSRNCTDSVKLGDFENASGIIVANASNRSKDKSSQSRMGILSGDSNRTRVHLRALHGGLWRLCNRITGRLITGIG